MEPIKKVLTISEIMHRKQMLSNKKDITEWCSRMQILQYIIQDDLSLVVYGDVDLSNKRLDYLPVKFLETKGNFVCSNNKLTSLENCPVIVGAIFDCSNNKLTSLEHSPKQVKSDFNCSNNKITSFQHITSVVGRSLNCSENPLDSLEHCPEIGYSLVCNSCNLINLTGCPSRITGSLCCISNQLINLDDSPRHIGMHFLCYRNPTTSLKGAPFFIGGNFEFGGEKITDLNLFTTDVVEDIVHFVKTNDKCIEGFEHLYTKEGGQLSLKIPKQMLNALKLNKFLNDELSLIKEQTKKKKI